MSTTEAKTCPIGHCHFVSLPVLYVLLGAALGVGAGRRPGQAGGGRKLSEERREMDRGDEQMARHDRHGGQQG